MSQKLPDRSPRFLLTALVVTVLASGAAFFWSNWQPSRPSSNGVAIAAAQPKGALHPKPATKAERTAAQKTIASQLHAFDTSNWKEAVKFQSAGLKGDFPTPEAFGEMIQKVYPAFVSPKKVVYGQSFNIAGHIQFEVSLTAQDGSITNAIYSLVKEQGNYRIEGVAGGATAQPDGDASMA